VRRGYLRSFPRKARRAVKSSVMIEYGGQGEPGPNGNCSGHLNLMSIAIGKALPIVGVIHNEGY
jgi:hypothetical protein